METYRIYHGYCVCSSDGRIRPVCTLDWKGIRRGGIGVKPSRVSFHKNLKHWKQISKRN